MSDPRSSYGDPVDEPADAPRDADVVGRAHEGLAEAEAARREVPEEAVAADPHAPDAPETVVVEETVVEEKVVVDDTDDDEDARWAAYAASADPETRPEETRREETVVVAPAVTPSEPVAEPAATSFPGPQPIFVQAPEAPRPRGNRGAAGAIGLLATVAFAVLFLAATLGFGLLAGAFEATEVVDTLLTVVQTWAFWVPVVVFFLAFWLLGAAINRGRWGHWVVWGLLVGVATWLGHLLGAVLQAGPFWMLSPSETAGIAEEQLFAPLAIIAFVLGRELTIWFGAWVASRGRRVTELNDEAQREYERTLEAGPQLQRA